MTTFTDDDKKLIKEIRERIICLVVSQLKKQKNYTKIW